MFYEDLGEYEKSYQLSLIAAYLSPQDADEWLRLAEVSDQLICNRHLFKIKQHKFVVPMVFKGCYMFLFRKKLYCFQNPGIRSLF